jgi:Tfp pilus assembly protein PilF
MAKAVKKIKKAIMKDAKDADNWITWGLILRTVGNYQSAKHKFKKALKLERENQTAREELETIEKIIELDKTIPLDLVHKTARRNPSI